VTTRAVSLVMPAFNSIRYVDDNVGRVLAFFDAAGIDGEVVLADDGSTDGTADSVRRDPRVEVGVDEPRADQGHHSRDALQVLLGRHVAVAHRHAARIVCHAD